MRVQTIKRIISASTLFTRGMRSLAVSKITALVAFASSAWGAPSHHSPWTVKESISQPRNWVKHSTAPKDHNIVLRLALPQPNFSVLEKHLYEVSDPRHHRYGAYLSKAEVDELVAPHKDSIDAVNLWLASHGIAETDVVRSSSQDWVTFTVPVGLAEEMLDTTYHVWKHIESDEYIIRTTSYSLPQHLHEHVDMVQPTTFFRQVKSAKSTGASMKRADKPPPDTVVRQPSTLAVTDVLPRSTIDPSCNTTVTINCLLQIYNAVGYQASATANNSFAITSYLEQFANLEDLQSFYADQRPDALNSSFTFISVNGGLNNQTLSEAGPEASLDVQYGFGLTHPIPGTFYSTGGRPPFLPDQLTVNNTNEPYLEWVEFVLAHENPPLTISTSYGDHEQTVPESLARRACASFAQLGARGVSLLFISGDLGVGDGEADPAKQQCQTNDGRNVTQFLPFFPASCPYVTTVGGTQGFNPEVASEDFFSGGGFSNLFERPSYQDQAIEAFLETLPEGTYAGLFNRSGRAYPDVAAQSENFSIFVGGKRFHVFGTSASTPVFAAFVALLNDARITNGLPPLGFLNPMLYSTGIKGLNDITSGSNPGCGTPGFNATKGWDPVTGLGSPNFDKLRQIVISY